ncbi:MAG: serpin family protein [Christensenellales bacterium]
MKFIKYINKAIILLLMAATLSGCAVQASPGVGGNIMDNTENNSAGGAGASNGQGGAFVPLKDIFELAQTESAEPVSPRDVNDYSDAKMLAGVINKFGYDMISLIDEGESFIFSPFSVYVALGNLSNGATGSAYEQMKAALYPDMSAEEFNKAMGELLALLVRNAGDDPQYSGYELAIASLVVTDEKYTLNENFAQLAARAFRAQTARARFADPDVKDHVNEWADEATFGLIPELFSEPIDPSTAAVILSSIYFSGKWFNEFNLDYTKDEIFHGAEGDVTVPMMQRNGDMLYFEDDSLQSVRLPYYGGAYMDIFLPKEGVSVEDVLVGLDGLYAEYKTYEGELKLPRFKTEKKTDLKEAIHALGIEDVFRGGLENLATGPDEILLSDAFQKAVVEVDEEGTKAAAVTALIVRAVGAIMPEGTFEMICDRPFAYTINVNVDGRQQVLFIGAQR